MDKKLKTIFEVRKSAALRMWDAENKQRAKSDASNKRTPSSIPVPAKSAPSQGVAEAKDPHEYDYEGDMAKSQLRSIIANAQRAHDMLEDDTNMAEWVQSKITLAADYISTVADYMQSEVNEDVEGVAEAYVASPLSAANANAEYNRQPSNTLKVDVKHLGGVSNHKAVKQHLASKGITAGIGSSDNYHTVHLSNINHSHGEVKQKLGIREDVDLEEAIKLGTKVKMHAPGKDYHDSVGSVGEIRHGAYKGAPKTYTVDYGSGKSVQLSKQNVKLHKESKSFLDIRKELDEKHLTPAEKTKREEIAKAMHRENPGMPMAKKMAIATAQAKKVAEDTEVNEAVTVKKANYPWGKMMTVHHGASTSYPLHPEHQQAIAKLGDGEKTSFKDETNSTVHAHREGDTVHLTRPRTSSTKTSIAHNHFNEETDVTEGNIRSYGGRVSRQS
jgi:hypothetical protein